MASDRLAGFSMEEQEVLRGALHAGVEKWDAARKRAQDMDPQAPRRRPMPRKDFAEGEPIMFIRDTDFGRQWEPGTYRRVWHRQGRSIWHEVKSATGERFGVPARRIRKESHDAI